jgi:hypothetical protein
MLKEGISICSLDRSDCDDGLRSAKGFPRPPRQRRQQHRRGLEQDHCPAPVQVDVRPGGDGTSILDVFPPPHSFRFLTSEKQLVGLRDNIIQKYN